MGLESRVPFVGNIGASIIRIVFWGHYTILIVRNPHNSIGNL